MKKPKFFWNEETGEAICILKNGEKKYIGTATCHPEDTDMKSEKIGCEIALRRATINALTDRRDSELKPAIKALKQVLHNIDQSLRWQADGYETYMLNRHIQRYQDDITTTNKMIAETKTDLINYIKNHAEFQKKIRTHREQKNRLDNIE